MCFCCPGTRLAEVYTCRGTKLKDGSVFIVVYRALKRALARSRYKLLQICQEGRSKMQKPWQIPSVLAQVVILKLSR